MIEGGLVCLDERPGSLSRRVTRVPAYRGEKARERAENHLCKSAAWVSE